MTTRIQATPDNPNPLPPHGGEWQREADGSLTLLQATQEAPPPAAPAAAPGAKPGKNQTPKE